MPRNATHRRRICFVTGTRAEFGLMSSTLRAIADSPSLQLQLVVTGMHLDPRHGRSIAQIRQGGWTIDATVPWPPGDGSAVDVAAKTGRAITGFAACFEKLKSEIVLVVGDRVEAFAAATAASLSGRIVTHVHGGDRALGQMDDSLRHAITKLSHLHFPATAQSAKRILKLGEDRWRIHRAGSPGIDGIRAAAASGAMIRKTYGVQLRRYAVMLLHPTEGDAEREHQRAEMLLRAVRRGVPEIIAIAPNSDPGARGILRCWEEHAGEMQFYRDLPRADFLGLLRDAAFLIGNSSSGIIEAASFRTPVIDVGNRQLGRERSGNVKHVDFRAGPIRKLVAATWREGRPVRWSGRNVYGGGDAGRKIAGAMAVVRIDDRLRRKLIAF